MMPIKLPGFGVIKMRTACLLGASVQWAARLTETGVAVGAHRHAVRLARLEAEYRLCAGLRTPMLGILTHCVRIAKRAHMRAKHYYLS
jgi:hypothetical protein